jgi:hypothetical protein
MKVILELRNSDVLSVRLDNMGRIYSKMKGHKARRRLKREKGKASQESGGRERISISLMKSEIQGY